MEQNNDLRRCARLLYTLLKEHSRLTGIADTTILSFYHGSWIELMQWIGAEVVEGPEGYTTWRIPGDPESKIKQPDSASD